MADVSVGQEGVRVRIVLRDKNMDPTDVYDQAKGVHYASSDESVLQVIDEDANPLDAELQLLAPGEATVTVVLDGAPGPVERALEFVTETITVHPEGAFSGEVVVEAMQVDDGGEAPVNGEPL